MTSAAGGFVYNHHELVVWQKANALAHEVYRVTKGFPRHEIFGLTSQLRRAALSVPTNIVEGSARQSKNETKRFADIALGSLAEVDYLFDFCFEEKMLTPEEYRALKDLRGEVGRLLWKFHRSLC